MKSLFVAVLSLAVFSTCFGLLPSAESVKYSSLEDFDDDTKFESLALQSKEQTANENVTIQLSVEVIRCLHLIAEKGLERASLECGPYIKYAIDYCLGKGREKSGQPEGGVDPCQNIIASTQGRKRGRSGSMGKSPQKKKQRLKTKNQCESLPQEKKKCKVGELYGQVPGNSLAAKCFRDPLNRRTKTQQLPFRTFKQNSAKTLSSKSNPKKGDVLVEVFTLPIGQGDCNIIKCNRGKNAIIFDCGSRGRNHLKEGKKFDSFIPSLLTGVEFVTILISHGHFDHRNMIMRLINMVDKLDGKVRTVIMGGELSDYPQYLQRKGQQVADKRGARKKNFFCDSAKIVFEFVQGNIGSNDKNEKGMLMKLTCRTCKSSLLFAGDMEGDTAHEFATDKSYSKFLRSTHYKMAHHGASDKANKKEWLEAIRPVEVHVSQMYNHGSYHHPRCEAFKRLIDLGSIGMASGAPGAKPHDLACFGEKDERYKPYDQCVYHRIFSTAPREDKICWIVLSFIAGEDAVTEYYCGDV